MQIIFFPFLYVCVCVCVWITFICSLKHSSNSNIESMQQLPNPKPLTCTTTKHAIWLAPYIRTHKMTIHWQKKDFGYIVASLFVEMSVMIMPMLLFRYFGTCVNSCRIILYTAISTRGKTIENRLSQWLITIPYSPLFSFHNFSFGYSKDAFI